jgi:hypothetical protein
MAWVMGSSGKLFRYSIRSLTVSNCFSTCAVSSDDMRPVSLTMTTVGGWGAAVASAVGTWTVKSPVAPDVPNDVPASAMTGDSLVRRPFSRTSTRIYATISVSVGPSFFGVAS